ncbi:universal stress protein [Halomarina ordinaria]|uniref:Universal stress protein n=1 Tax=Halomarina ordinaria TaxID=3033939 RepID=A0ABD5UAH5_9EURY|nr:universal stress protein [Halomarina sp. PSRA2]
MTEKVLVPVDGSPLSMRALRVALAERSDATVTALHVIDPSEPGYSYFGADVDVRSEPRHGTDEWFERADGYERDLFAEAADVAAEYDRPLETVTLVGDPARVIVDYVVDHGFDHVVLGSHGRGEDSHVTLGSVTEAVAFRAPVRVSIVR